MLGKAYWDAWLYEKFSWDDRLELFENGVIKDQDLVYHPVNTQMDGNDQCGGNERRLQGLYGIEHITFPELLKAQSHHSTWK